MRNSELDRLLDPGYLADLGERTLQEIRGMREACQAAEGSLSFSRRMAQGRIDIVESELERRRRGEAPAPLGELIDRLPGILSEHGGRSANPAQGRAMAAIAPAELSADLTGDLDEIANPRALSEMVSMSDDAVAAMLERLRAHERTISDARREMHHRIDALHDEISRRYRSGEASVESLLS